ncbi:MAG: response regulator [Bryobacteraceae bacterium]
MHSASTRRGADPARILLVNDNTDGNSARQSVLEELGYKVFSARCGREALQVLEKESVDLIITDYRMSPVNGLELIAKIRQASKALPVVLLTGFAESLGLTPENTGADIVIQKSSRELPTLLRTAKKLLHPPKKSARSHTGRKLLTRAHSVGS